MDLRTLIREKQGKENSLNSITQNENDMVNWLKCFWFLQQMIDWTIRRFDTMRTIFAEYNPQRNSIDVYTSAGYMLRIDCWEAEKDL